MGGKTPIVLLSLEAKKESGNVVPGLLFAFSAISYSSRFPSVSTPSLNSNPVVYGTAVLIVLGIQRS